MSYVRSFFKNPHLDFSKINAHFTRKHYCRVCLGRKNRIEHLSGRSILPPLSNVNSPAQSKLINISKRIGQGCFYLTPKRSCFPSPLLESSSVLCYQPLEWLGGKKVLSTFRKFPALPSPFARPVSRRAFSPRPGETHGFSSGAVAFFFRRRYNNKKRNF